MRRYIPCAACWWPTAPKPPVIGAAAPDAQAAGGVCYVYWQGKVDSGAVPDPFPPGGRTIAAGHATASLLVVSKSALAEGLQRKRSA